jgi:predicted amidohydrolase YtcJ
MSRDYSKSPHFRTGGVKLVLDGSPQGRSAWFRAPYVKPPDGQQCGYRGVANYPLEDHKKGEERLTELLIEAYKKEWQVIVHANGDAAIDQWIRVEHAARRAVPANEDRRTVLIHGQFLQRDQIESVRDLKIFPSLFPMHTFYWGDWYVDILGEQRANFISPTKAVQDQNMMFSIHSDAPVTKPNSMRLLDSAVNRTTRKPIVLGKDQRIDPIVALKALTIWPAYQHFEENTKGSIEVGKNADLVVLNRDPMHMDRRSIICIQILQTIKNGEQVYPKNGETPLYRDGPGAGEKKYKTCADEQKLLRPPNGAD